MCKIMLLSTGFRCGVFREASAAILFFGMLAQQPALHQAGQAALSELAGRGYNIPSENDPVRVFPALTDGSFSGGHAGGWRPGSIYLRWHPQGDFDSSVYLRHELLHEASHRSCAGRLPLWAEEAAAMYFSGELAHQMASDAPSEQDRELLLAAVRRGANLAHSERETLGRLLMQTGWPESACAVSASLAALLGAPFDANGSSAFLLMSLSSGRILEISGDRKTRYPPGSLLKIPYAAALKQADPVSLGAELVASNTDKLLGRQDQLDIDRLHLLLAPLKTQEAMAMHPVAAPDVAGFGNSGPNQSSSGEGLASLERAASSPMRAYLGERNADGGFPIEGTLNELALVLRISLLSKPFYFSGLSQNGVSPDSTLAAQSAPDKRLLQQLHALSKTGTVSDTNGNPLLGHLLVLWPAEHPVYLALFRQRGVPGAALLHRAAQQLAQWRQTRPVLYSSAKVRLLTLTPRGSWEAQQDCPALTAVNSRVSLCGQFRIVSSAKGSRSERWVSGILKEQSAGGPVVLETDSETYADAVLAAEAQELKGAARAALRAVIVWNGSHGAHRHNDSSSLCDTTHCMVFMGNTVPAQPEQQLSVATDPRLLRYLDRLAGDAKLDWLSFANGGDERWQRRLDGEGLALRLGEPTVLDVRRERRKDGAVLIHLLYPENEEVLGCEIFRNAFKLPSCPDAIEHLVSENAWVFSGAGAGHGQGMAVQRAKALAEAGWSAEDILRDAYGKD